MTRNILAGSVVLGAAAAPHRRIFPAEKDGPSRGRASPHSAARLLFESGTVWIAKTVLLEADWVLRSLYGFDQSAVRNALTRLLGLGNVHAEDEAVCFLLMGCLCAALGGRASQECRA